MNELWVARDESGELNTYTGKPDWSFRHQQWWATSASRHVATINSRFYPDLKPGECRRLVLAEETT